MFRGLMDRLERRRRAHAIERRLRELDRLDQEQADGPSPTSIYGARPTRSPWARAKRPSKPRRQSNGTLPGLLVAGLIVAAVVAFSPGDTTRALRSLIGLTPDRLGDPPAITHGGGNFAFMQTQPHSDAPVSYDPCRVIEYVVNPQDAPDNHEELVATAVQHTSTATGFQFEHRGTTDRRDWELGGVAGRHDPVLIGWADEAEFDQLAGDVAGVGGSLSVRSTTNRLRYTTGRVVLDAELFERLEDMPHGRVMAQSIIDHEFGHLVGLDHVDDPKELMNSDNVGVTSYGPGDREGLAMLGNAPCS